MPEPKRSVRRLLILAAVATFFGTLFMWALGSGSWTHAEFEVGRVVLGNVPGAVVAFFYVGVSSFLALMLYLFSLRAKNWERGASERRWGRWAARWRELDKGLRMKTLLEDRAAGLMHAAIYYGFVVLFLGTVTLEVDHLVPEGLKFLHGVTYQAFSFILDLAAVVFLFGLAWAFVRRYLNPPWRLRAKTKPEDAWILALLALIGVTGLLTEAARIRFVGTPDFEVWSFAGYAMAPWVPEASAGGWHQAFWILHAVAFLALLVVVPTTKLRHSLLSPVNMFLSPHDRPKGAMKPMPDLMTTDLETFGAAVVSDLTWKQIFDTDACTVCGRCTSVCPANTTGKSLDPREIVLKVGEVSALSGSPVVSSTVSLVPGISVTADSLFERITTDELFSCTTCRACDEVCPVNIEILDKILDMRRYKTLMESDFPSDLGKSFVALENSGNPWGLNQATRADWTKALEFEVPVLGEDTDSAEYLYWVGCAGSFDDRNVNVSRAVATLLHAAGVDFAILGAAETCTGDSARRAGNEYLFQMMAAQNIETLDGFGVKKIITQCPHCFTTLGNDYKQFSGDYEVIHHSQFLSELIRQGLLDPDLGGADITYHDACYLGRHNDVYLDPREVVASTGNLIEMERSGTRSFCCGAGGARFWTEEATGKKINIERAEEAIATGAGLVAVACPFCYVMLDDGVKELGREGVQVKDIAMLLADAVQRKQT